MGRPAGGRVSMVAITSPPERDAAPFLGRGPGSRRPRPAPRDTAAGCVPQTRPAPGTRRPRVRGYSLARGAPQSASRPPTEPRPAARAAPGPGDPPPPGRAGAVRRRVLRGAAGPGPHMGGGSSCSLRNCRRHPLVETLALAPDSDTLLALSCLPALLRGPECGNRLAYLHNSVSAV